MASEPNNSLELLSESKEEEEGDGLSDMMKAMSIRNDERIVLNNHVFCQFHAKRMEEANEIKWLLEQLESKRSRDDVICQLLDLLATRGDRFREEMDYRVNVTNRLLPESVANLRQTVIKEEERYRNVEKEANHKMWQIEWRFRQFAFGSKLLIQQMPETDDSAEAMLLLEEVTKDPLEIAKGLQKVAASYKANGERIENMKRMVEERYEECVKDVHEIPLSLDYANDLTDVNLKLKEGKDKEATEMIYIVDRWQKNKLNDMNLLGEKLNQRHTDISNEITDACDEISALNTKNDEYMNNLMKNMLEWHQEKIDNLETLLGKDTVKPLHLGKICNQ